MFTSLDYTEIKRKNIPKTIKNMLWINTFGKDKSLGNCYICEKEIHITEFETGHIIPVSKGGSDDISNLKPLCSICNKSVGTDNLDDFKRSFLNEKKGIYSDEIKEYDFSYSKPQLFIINDEQRPCISYKEITREICKFIGKDEFIKITKLKTMDYSQYQKNPLNGYTYDESIDLAIMGYSANILIKENLRLLDILKVQYVLKIKLADNNNIQIINKE